MFAVGQHIKGIPHKSGRIMVNSTSVDFFTPPQSLPVPDNLDAAIQRLL